MQGRLEPQEFRAVVKWANREGDIVLQYYYQLTKYKIPSCSIPYTLAIETEKHAGLKKKYYTRSRAKGGGII